MLIEFSVGNFRSFRERQVLSLIASNRDKDLPNNLLDLEAPGLANTRLVKSVAVYGANASGKSNLFKAAEFMQDFVGNSATKLKPGEETGVMPFRLDPSSERSPTEFEVVFIYEGIRYQYGFILDNKKVHEEWLVAYPFGQPQRWFTRTFNPDTDEYDWKFSAKHLKGDKESLKGKTRDNTLFLSVGAQFNHEQLTEVYEWFQDSFRFIDFSSAPFPSSVTATLMGREKAVQEPIRSLIKQADLGITEVDIMPMNLAHVSFPDDLPDDVKEKYVQRIKDGEILEAGFRHRCRDAEQDIVFDEDLESAGTRKYFSLLGPWML
ncbi:MAG: ATP-binding protein, partial [bacterium]